MLRSLVLLGALAALAGCSVSGSDEEPQPGEEVVAPAPEPGTGAPAPPASPAPSAPGASDPAPAPAPAPKPAPGAGVFAGEPAYEAKLGPSTIDLSGKGNGHLSFNAQGNPAGRACLDCHDGTGKGGAPAFLFAGTVYLDAAGTKPAPSVEVRMVGPDGNGFSAYTDANGNYFFPKSNGAVSVPAVAGARNATTVRNMANKINDANCNQCHGTTARIVL